MNRIKTLALLFAAILFSCGEDNGLDENDNRSGEPYKLKVEIIAEKPDLFTVGWGMGKYNFVDENGLPRTVWFTPDDLEEIPSPCIKEFEIPRYFTKMSVYSALISIDPTISDSFEGIIRGKLYVNNKMLTEFSCKFGWSVGIEFKNKKFTITNSNEIFVLDKID